ncbi:MAG TPA: DsbE family thiol:disulfide interchange protein [Dongiaceae bacterium]|jgi:cytochrome c biogenesis protein CcmG/thiol:disulfide interchange protein DsbE|nr:DsbE family thiol:disulfide interchange protein [Dongiaceae bacterium]
MRRLVFLLPVLIVALLVAAFWRGLDPNRDPSALPSALVGKAAPAVDLPGLADGAPRLQLAAFKGKLVAINFFASWCVPCRAEHPYLKQVGAELGVPVIGIAWKDKTEASRAFLAELGDPYAATGADENGRTGIDFGITGVPETFLVDGAGIVRYRLAGPVTPETLKGELAPAIAEARK